MSSEIVTLIREIEFLQERLNANHQIIFSKIQNIQSSNRRLTVFTQLFGILDRAKMGFEYSHFSLNSEEIKASMFSGLTNDEFIQRVNSFIHFIAIEMNHAYFSVIEAFLRQIQRVLAKNSPKNFWELKESILKTLNLQQWAEFLRFYSYIRNTQHNNGLFFPSDQKDIEVSYKGKIFPFICAQKIEFLNPDLRLILVSDGNSFVYDVCTSEKVIAFPYIPDPSHFEYTPIQQNTTTN